MTAESSVTTVRPSEKLYRKMAMAMDAWIRCKKEGNVEWEGRWKGMLLEWVNLYLPGGSGFDNGTELDLESSTGERLVFRTSYHHMNSDGFYVGWTGHEVIVKPSLMFGFDLRITGRDQNDFKESAYEVFQDALSREITED